MNASLCLVFFLSFPLNMQPRKEKQWHKKAKVGKAMEKLDKTPGLAISTATEIQAMWQT